MTRLTSFENVEFEPLRKVSVEWLGVRHDSTWYVEILLILS